MDLIEKLHEIINIALDGLQDLKEQADPRGVLLSQVRDKTPIVFTHLYKIFAFGQYNSKTVHHWCAELGAFLKTFCYKLCKHNKKVLPITDIITAIKSKYCNVAEFSSIAGDLYPEYGYSEHKDSELYALCFHSIMPLITYMRTLSEDDRPDPNKIYNILKNECNWL